jgi:hypothetical protein
MFVPVSQKSVSNGRMDILIHSFIGYLTNLSQLLMLYDAEISNVFK